MKIQWHAGFVSAIELELAENRADLIYEREHILNKKPLEIDLLVVKKDDKAQVENKIGLNHLIQILKENLPIRYLRLLFVKILM